MPYSKKGGSDRFQKASKLSQRTIVNNEKVKQKLESYSVCTHETDDEDVEEGTIPADELPQRNLDLKYALAFDGSSQEVAVDEDYPSTRVSYVQIGGVFVRLDQLRDQRDNRVIDPSAIKESYESSVINTCLPGANVTAEGFDTVTDSWRNDIFSFFESTEFTVDGSGTSILDIFNEIAKYSDKNVLVNGESRLQLDTELVEDTVNIPLSESITTTDKTLFPTDVLRLHEEVNELTNNTLALNRLMILLEHLSVAFYMKELFDRQPTAVSRSAFLIDGPLAFFGPQAWMHKPYLEFYQEIVQDIRQESDGIPLLMGIEKSGPFVDHALNIEDQLSVGTLKPLTQDYIFRHILSTESAGEGDRNVYGDETYYGRKFIYKNRNGAIFVFSIPPLDQGRPYESMDVEYDDSTYRHIGSAVKLLDQIETQLYENALIPAALAHKFASIPLSTGEKVLEVLSLDHLS